MLLVVELQYGNPLPSKTCKWLLEILITWRGMRGYDVPIQRFKATDKLSTKWVYMSVEVDIGPVTLVGNITST